MSERYVSSAVVADLFNSRTPEGRTQHGWTLLNVDYRIPQWADDGDGEAFMILRDEDDLTFWALPYRVVRDGDDLIDLLREPADGQERDLKLRQVHPHKRIVFLPFPGSEHLE